MGDTTQVRRVRVAHGVGADFAVPADVADLIGDEAELEVGPGKLVTLRPAKLRSSALASGVPVLDDVSRLRHSSSPMSADERAALATFLSE